ncbi:epoxide hydrolase [Sphingobium phenoxybenzoativorans]|uniref:Epoxide hydrolase n=1 Tax=Sphingobium phenoxybenzoativorans TaxID=1592790 RepID=A0A975K573_9SPHN|nr:epoxide hydrolase family protein [Sphingobium phenoxybenzoativorans]QUT05056.1 epoxide hydrolase [Sphingobium phenoxybenzoativorans]
MNDIRPFQIAVAQADLDDLARRLDHVRLPDRETAGDGVQGPPMEEMRALLDHWRTRYDWRRCEAKLNAFPQFITEVDGVDIHFIHVRSPRADATPILLAHGWPGSILEFEDCIGPLSDPAAYGAPDAPAFHVIVPSMPGFGFSGKPSEPGWHIGRIAGAYATLMARLGYDGWICQGGDLGSAVAEAMGHMRAQGCAGLHLNMSFFQPTPEEIQNADEQEREYLGRARVFFEERMGYFAVQGTRPQTIAYALADSPAGLAAWMFDKFFEAADYHGGHITDALSMDRMLDGISLYWLTNSGASSAKLYWELKRAMPPAPPPPIGLPTAYSGFAGETILASRRWLEKRFTALAYYNLVDRGGHFAAWEQPALFVNELRAMAPHLLKRRE